MKLIKNWFNSFINLFFPSITAYRTHDKEIIEYIENNTLIEMNCKRILVLSPLLIALPAFGIKGVSPSNLFAFILVVITAFIISAYTVYVCIKTGKSLKNGQNKIRENKQYFERLYEYYWLCWVIGMLFIGFSKLNTSLNGSYLYLTQLCLAFFPLVTPKKLKKIGIWTAIWAIILTANLLYYGNDELFISAIAFILTNMVIVFLLSYVIQRLNLSINVMVAYVKFVGFLDSLTGAYNRRGFQFKINELIKDSSPAGIIMLDIDYFKQYNDTYGHSKGDEILKTLASTIRNAVDRKNQIVVRFGGEEFAIICVNSDIEETKAVAERIRDAIADLNIPSAEKSVSDCLTVSMGINMQTISKDELLVDLVEDADKALYEAKETGRNKIVIR